MMRMPASSQSWEPKLFGGNWKKKTMKKIVRSTKKLLHLFSMELRVLSDALLTRFEYVFSLVSLMDKVGLQKNSCKVIDVTNKRGTVETLTETKILCSIEEKVCDQSRS